MFYSSSIPKGKTQKKLQYYEEYYLKKDLLNTND
jgi:hypothetical protein